MDLNLILACNLAEMQYIKNMKKKYELYTLNEQEIRTRLFPIEWHDLEDETLKLQILKEALDKNILVEETQLMLSIIFDQEHIYDL